MKREFRSLEAIPEMQRVLSRTAINAGGGHPLPPTLVSMPGAIELEPLMDSFCDDLEAAGYVEFSGSRRWLGMSLDYQQEPGFPAFEQMLRIMHKYAGYRNRFGGVLLVDLTQWSGHTDDKRFDELLAYIHDYSDEIYFLVHVNADEPMHTEQFKKAFSRWMYTLMIDIESPAAACLTARLVRRLGAKGYTPDAQAEALLGRTVDALTGLDDFAGIREIDSLAASICAACAGRYSLDADALADFAPDGAWMKQRLGEERITIGFTGGFNHERS